MVYLNQFYDYPRWAVNPHDLSPTRNADYRWGLYCSRVTGHAVNKATYLDWQFRIAFDSD